MLSDKPGRSCADMYMSHRHDVIAAHTRTSPSFTLADRQSIVTSAATQPHDSLRP